MRTTVELSDSTYTRLRSAAAERGMRGFSSIVEDAVRLYLEGERERAEIADDIAAARGAWSEEEAAELEGALRDGWASGWRIDRSSTQTS